MSFTKVLDNTVQEINLKIAKGAGRGGEQIFTL